METLCRITMQLPLFELILKTVLIAKCGPKLFLLTKCGPYYIGVVPALFAGFIIITSSAMFIYP